MPVLSDQTRENIRVTVGRNLGAVYLGTMSACGSTSTVVDSTLRGGADAHNGKHIWFTGPTNNDGSYRRVDDFACITLTVDGAAITSTVACDTYELWLSNFDPQVVNEFINASVRDTYGFAWDDVEDRSLHGSTRAIRFDIPTGISMLTEVQYLDEVRDRQVIPDRIWDEKLDTGFTSTLDSEDPIYGRRGMKLVYTGSTCGHLASDSIGTLDLSGFTHVEFGFKAVATVAACDVLFRLDDTACNSSPIESITIPAIGACDIRQDIWVRLALANPESDTAIISVALEYNANAKANTFWITDIRATNVDTEEWKSLHPREWRINKPNRDLHLTPGGRNRVGFSTIRLIGGDEPVLLNADATVSQVDGYYISSKATEMTLNALGSARTERQERDRLYWHAEALTARKSIPVVPNIRVVE